MQRTLDYDRVVLEFGEPLHCFKVGGFLGGRRKNLGQFHKKERVLENIEFEFLLRQSPVPQGLHKGMGELGVPHKL